MYSSEFICCLVQVNSFLLLQDHTNILNNNISILPKEIKYLTNLSILDLKNNNITILPKEIKYLFLNYLDCSNNNIKVLPKEIKYLILLHTLILNNNNITVLPKEIKESIKNTRFIK